MGKYFWVVLYFKRAKVKTYHKVATSPDILVAKGKSSSVAKDRFGCNFEPCVHEMVQTVYMEM